MGADQFSHDFGNWELAWPLTLFKDPPIEVEWYRKRGARKGEVEGLSPAVDPRWGSAMLSFLEQVDGLQKRRANLRARVSSSAAPPPTGAAPSAVDPGGAAAAAGPKRLPWKEWKALLRAKAQAKA